ncbi:MAG: hypothetical protein ACRD47_04490 [Nitrososphaeraceae archaeon]
MIRIIHSPIEQIIIHEMVEYTLSDFVKYMTLGVAPEGTSSLVKWCDGIIFAHVSMPSTADVVKDQMNGIVHWAWFSYAEMISFKDYLESTHNVRIPIIDVSNNDLNRELVRWLKKNRIGR